jgi:hypothetical protein
MKRKITVVTNKNGEVAGTQLGHGEPNPKTGIATSVVAGPGQQLHKIEFEIPQLSARADIEAFHDKLAEHLKKSGGRKKS